MAADPEVSSKEFEDDLDVENIFQLKQYHSDAPLQVTETPFSSDIPSRINLLQVSNTYGYAIIGTPDVSCGRSVDRKHSSQSGFLYTELKDLRQSLKSNESELRKVVVNLASPCKTRYLALSSDELTLFVAIAKDGPKAELWIYDVREVAKSSAVVPVHKVSVDCEEIMDIRPNTGDQAELVALLGDNRKLTLVDSKAGNVLRVFPMDDITSRDDIPIVCWSPKGKQIAIGTATGTIYQLSSNGDIKQTIPPPADFPGRFVDELAWVHSSTFIAFVTEELDCSASSDLVIVQLADKGVCSTRKFSL
ncbi:hypothetical protein BKA69DRAFT_1036114 [Paraphysoderma sedebokerense]|nr:hypothetical protein BKA69DRAFT_1036114 [Paraphysoderma sedebokerense]